MRCASVSGSDEFLTLLPERRVVAPRNAVVQDDEVTNTLELVTDEGVVARNIRGVKLLVGKMIEQIEQCVGREMQVGGCERLEETRGAAQSHHVLVPEPAASARSEFLSPGLDERLAAHCRQQLGPRLVVTLESARIHVAMAQGLLQRRAPLPARSPRGDTHVGRSRIFECARSADHAIAGQPLLPVFIGRLEDLADELAARTTAVDEQIGAQFPAVFELQLVDEAILAARGTNNLAREQDHSGALGDGSQVARHEHGVDMQRITQMRRDAQRVRREDEAVGHA